MHCRLSILGLALVALCAPGYRPAVPAADVTTTVYVGRYFEVRDYDQPVKYVFDGETRVARITGSLSSSPRIQRLRLRTGWNLISLAVTATNFLGQIQTFNEGTNQEPLLRAAYRWQPSTGNYQSVQPGDSVPGGAVLWLHARTNQMIALQGDYTEPTSPTIPAGGTFVPNPGLEVWSVQPPPGATLWQFDPGARIWQADLPGELAPFGNAPGKVAPGDPIYIHSPTSIELSIPRPESRVAYYHPDHLDSSSIVTDAAGEVVEETAHHPFGAARHQSRSGEIDPNYGFTQKERDRESRLHYFEARYLVDFLARFLSYDPMVQHLERLDSGALRDVLLQPAKWNPFAYALNNPVRYNDPDGRDPRPRPNPARGEQPKPAQPRTDLTVRPGPPSKLSRSIVAVASTVAARHATPRRGGTRGDSSGGSVFEITVSRTEDISSTDLFTSGTDDKPVRGSGVPVQPGKGNRPEKPGAHPTQPKKVPSREKSTEPRPATSPREPSRGRQ